MDYVTSNIMLPLGGLLIAVFTAWLISRKAVIEELGLGEGLLFQTWLFVVRYVAPIGVVVIFFHAVEII
jgi:NSS family neurotransmitter:Na+ symporter